MLELYEITEEMEALGQELACWELQRDNSLVVVKFSTYPNDNYFTLGKVYEVEGGGKYLLDDTQDRWSVGGSGQGYSTAPKLLFALKSDIDAIIAKNSNEPKPITSLRNVKIDLRKPDGSVDEGLSAAFQEAVFESGGSWKGGKPDVKNLFAKFLFVSSEGCLTWDEKVERFRADSYKQINFTYRRIFEWEATETVDEKACKRAEVQKVVDTLQGQLDSLQEQLRAAQEDLGKI